MFWSALGGKTSFKDTGWIRVIIYFIHYYQTELKGNKMKKGKKKKDLDSGSSAELHDISLIYKYINSWLDSFLIKHFFLEKKSET